MKQVLKPEFETEVKGGMFNCITKIDNPYLQAWTDSGAYVMFNGWDTGFWLMTNLGQLWFKIQENDIHLECISVISDDRRQGKGGKLMDIVIELANETGTKVSLRVANVSNSSMMMPHPVVGQGMVKKNKIPVRSLPKWYKKFGFIKDEDYTEKSKTMTYTPKKK